MFFEDIDYQKLAAVPKKKVTEVVLALIADDPHISNQELAKQLGKCERQVKRYLKDLIDGGSITSRLCYNVFWIGGQKKITTIRTLEICNIKKLSQ